MKKIQTSILFLCFCFSSVLAQNNEIEVAFSKMFSHLYSNQDSAYFYKNKIIKLSKQNKDFKSLFYAYLYSNKTASVFNNLDEIKRNLKSLDSLFLLEKPTYNTIKGFSSIKNSYLFDKAIYYYKLNDYKNAQYYLNNLIENNDKNSKSQEDLNLINVAYSTLAKIHSNNGEYDLANTMHDKNIRFLNENPDEYLNLKLTAIYRLKGEIYKRLKDYKTSNLFLKKAFKNRPLNQANVNAYITEANGIAENYLALNQLDSSLLYLEKFKTLKDNKSPYSYLYYVTHAQINQKLNNNEDAKNSFNKAIQLVTKKWQNNKHIEIAQIHQKFADFYLKNNNIKEALAQNQMAIEQVTGEDVVNSSINKIQLLKGLNQKSNIYIISNQNQLALNTSKKATNLLDSLKPIFKSQQDKLLLIENAYSIFENGLEASYQLKDNNSAFYFTEKSKSIILLEALLSIKASSFSQIPTETLQKEQAFKTQILALEKQVNLNQDNTLQDSLFNTKIAYRKFINNLENKYQDYYNLKYNTNTITLDQAQQNLDNNTAILSFFYGNNAIYLISISKEKILLDKINITDQLEQNIKDFQRQISTPNSEISKLKTNAKSLYHSLLAKSLNTLKVKNLILLTDGLLNYIPFETLIKDNRFLVEDYAISYINSMTLLNEINQKNGIKNSLLAFAPSFDGNITSSNLRSSLQALPHNKTEIQNINQYYKGDLFFNENATLTNFKNNAKNYGILHLATHAIYNDSNPEFSYLAFGNDAKNLLYVSDLYNLNLNANLVTLSACESGIGDLKRGEGLLSLARGFYFSGTKSIASTLWKINDASSAQLMSDFYKNLAQEQTKQIALQQAKIDFLKENKDNALSHPYYWSAFVLSGNTDALINTNYWLWISLGLAGFALIGLFFKKKKLNSNR